MPPCPALLVELWLQILAHLHYTCLTTVVGRLSHAFRAMLVLFPLARLTFRERPFRGPELDARLSEDTPSLHPTFLRFHWLQAPPPYDARWRERIALCGLIQGETHHPTLVPLANLATLEEGATSPAADRLLVISPFGPTVDERAPEGVSAIQLLWALCRAGQLDVPSSSSPAAGPRCPALCLDDIEWSLRADACGSSSLILRLFVPYDA